MNKCKWEDDIMSHCNKFDGQFIYDIRKYNNGGVNVTGCKCLYCHEYMHKPEPEVIIKKSGGTWVARYDGVDYLYYYPVPNDMKEPPPLFMSRGNMNMDERWKPISEIIITDEIAKLRPMVVISESILHKLWGKDTNLFIFGNGHYDGIVRLATVSDLN